MYSLLFVLFYKEVERDIKVFAHDHVINMKI